MKRLLITLVLLVAHGSMVAMQGLTPEEIRHELVYCQLFARNINPTTDPRIIHKLKKNLTTLEMYAQALKDSGSLIQEIKDLQEQIIRQRGNPSSEQSMPRNIVVQLWDLYSDFEKRAKRMDDTTDPQDVHAFRHDILKLKRDAITIGALKISESIDHLLEQISAMYARPDELLENSDQNEQLSSSPRIFEFDDNKDYFVKNRNSSMDLE